MHVENNDCPLEISDDDILEAMKDISGYLDITTQDFREIYMLAYTHALQRVKHSVKAKDVMTRNVITVEPDTVLEDVADTLADNGIAGVPVMDSKGNINGVISEKDFLFSMGVEKTGSFLKVIAQCLKNKGCIAIPIRKQKAENIMTSPVITVSEDTSIYEISKIFTEKNINRTPVIDSEGKLAGIITRTDIVKSSCAAGY